MTEELNKKLAEWAGWTKFSYIEPITKIEMQSYPDFTQSLDACFKWLVPENAIVQFLPSMEGVTCLVCHLGEWYVGKAEKKWEAQSLCLAIEKLIDKEIK